MAAHLIRVLRRPISGARPGPSVAAAVIAVGLVILGSAAGRSADAQPAPPPAGTAPVTTPPATDPSPTTTTALPPGVPPVSGIAGRLPASPATVPLVTKAQDGRLDPLLAKLSLGGFAAFAVLLLGRPLVLAVRRRR